MTKLGEGLLAGMKEARSIMDGTVTEGFVVHTPPAVDVASSQGESDPQDGEDDPVAIRPGTPPRL